MEDTGFVETWSKQKFSPERDVFIHVLNAFSPLYLMGVSRNRHYPTPVPQVASTSTIVEIWEKFDRGCSRFYFSKDGCSNVSCPHGLLEPYLSLIKRWRQDFSGGPVVKNLPSKAGDTGSIPGLGRFHMLRGNCWARLLMLCNEKPPQWDILAPQLEKACEQQGRPSTKKKKKRGGGRFPFSWIFWAGGAY